ncbi:hypothetical protein O0L34_g10555 [Tuta absoluta]|nr:hypothetical protein O0L34_g10555 [Tuta absoluta]
MMVMAMLGFYFEVSRHDRDKFIRVHMRHVRPDKLHHFEKIREDATFPLPYDYKSATHPAWQFWRQIGKSGISTVATLKSTDPDGLVMKSLGQNRQLLSDLDILKINSVYGIDCFISLHGERQGKEREEGQELEETVRGRENERVEKEEEPRGEKEKEARREKEEQPRGENEEDARGEEDKEEKRVRGNPEEEDVASDEGE